MKNQITEKDQRFASIFSTVMILLFLAYFIIISIQISNDLNPPCRKSGCERLRVEGSEYCYVHEKPKQTKYSSSTYSSNHYSSKKYSSSNSSNKNSSTNKSSSSSSYSNSTKKGTTTTTNPYQSYDDGYDDVYDGDYDSERYATDWEYADGVDDALDELDEDW